MCRLKNLGLDCIEAFHPKHNAEDIKRYITIAKNLGLGITAGSDFHGNGIRKLRKLCHVSQRGLLTKKEFEELEDSLFETIGKRRQQKTAPIGGLLRF